MASPLRLAFMGSPDFAVPVLGGLIEAGHEVACVYCQPPRPSGRGHRPQLTPVNIFAENTGLPVRTPKSLKNEHVQAEFEALELDAGVVAAYGLILPPSILQAPRLGCFNVHASLLPRWRGAAPIQRTIAAGDTETGVTIMQMDEGLDTGPELTRAVVPITGETTGGSLHDELAILGADLILKVLEEFKSLTPIPQPDTGVTYAEKLDRAEARLDWSLGASEIERRVRAFTPWPGSWFEESGDRISVLGIEVAEGNGAPGEVLDDVLTIACGTGAVRVTKLQRAGGKAMSAAKFLRGRPLTKGTRLK